MTDLGFELVAFTPNHLGAQEHCPENIRAPDIKKVYITSHDEVEQWCEQSIQEHPKPELGRHCEGDAYWVTPTGDV